MKRSTLSVRKVPESDPASLDEHCWQVAPTRSGRVTHARELCEAPLLGRERTEESLGIHRHLNDGLLGR